MSKVLLSILLLFTGAMTVGAQELTAVWVHDMALDASRHRSIHKPAEKTRELVISSSASLPSSVAQQAQSVAASSQRVTLALIEKGQVLFQYRRPGVRDNSSVISYSMAKSLTAMMVGHALCARHINDLNDKLGQYVPELAGTAYGNASIKNLLNMASGANASGAHGEPYWGFTTELREQKTTYRENLQKFSHPQTRLFSQVEPGSFFDYKNLDTAALGWLIEKVTQRPFHQWFEETLVPSAGLGMHSSWALDRDKLAMAHAYFFAAPDDWVRLALYSLDAYKGRAGTCMQDFMQKAVHDTVRVYNNNEYTRYGYQFWTGMPGVNKEVFWMRGYGGQYIGVDPQKERILVAASTQHDPQVVSLFRNWVNSD